MTSSRQNFGIFHLIREICIPETTSYMQNTILIDCTIITRAAPMSNKFSVFVGMSLSIRQTNNAAQPVLDLLHLTLDLPSSIVGLVKW